MEQSYIYPVMPKRLSPSSALFSRLERSGEWIAQFKRNGWRCLAYRDSSGLKLWTRHKTVIPDALPGVRNVLLNLPPGSIIDGELIDKRTRDTKDTFYAFDVIRWDVSWWWDEPLTTRLRILDRLAGGTEDGLQVAGSYEIGFKKLYEQAIAQGDEGLVLKYKASRYPIAFDKSVVSPWWIKIKKTEEAWK